MEEPHPKPRGRAKLYKDWGEARSHLVDDIAEEFENATEGDYCAVIVKVDPQHNPISGYWVLKKP
jgi:hypothetical protein